MSEKPGEDKYRERKKSPSKEGGYKSRVGLELTFQEEIALRAKILA